jgi:hypothetical protein
MSPDELSRRLTIVTPCKMKWRDMTGDERVRRCAQCQLDVYNVREMATGDVEALIGRGARTCVQVVRRRDGTVVMGDCRLTWKRRRAEARARLARPKNLLVALGALIVLCLAAVTLFGDNLRAALGQSAGGIGGEGWGEPVASATPPPVGADEAPAFCSMTGSGEGAQER